MFMTKGPYFATGSFSARPATKSSLAGVPVLRARKRSPGPSTPILPGARAVVRPSGPISALPS